MKKLMVYPVKFAVAVSIALALWALSLVGLFSGLRGEAGLLFALSLPFLYIIYVYGSVVTMDEEGLTLSFLGIRRRHLPWAQVREVGILGPSVFSEKQKKTGTPYLYFSEKELSKDELFQLGLRWPPKNLIFLRYTLNRVTVLQQYWTEELRFYNEGQVEL